MVHVNSISDKWQEEEEVLESMDTTHKKVLQGAAEREDEESSWWQPKGDYTTMAAPPGDNNCRICGALDHWTDECPHGNHSTAPSAQLSTYPGSNGTSGSQQRSKEADLVPAENEECRTSILSVSRYSSAGDEKGTLPTEKEARDVVGSAGRPRRNWCAALSLVLALISLGGVVALFVLLVPGRHNKCSSNLDCAGENGTLTCALAEVDADAPMICCASAALAETSETAALGFAVSSSSNIVCKDLPDGSKCGNVDTICSSGRCVNSVCLSSTLQDGQACTDNSDCASKSCALVSLMGQQVCCPSNYYLNDGVCEEPGTLPVSAACIDNLQCGNQACGHRGADVDSSKVCCESGELFTTYVNDDKITLCRDSFEIGEECVDANQCRNGACGQTDALFNSTAVCCESGDTVTGYVNDGVNQYDRRFCTMQPTSTYCGSRGSSMCASGLCINEFCVEEALEVGEVCRDDSDCKNPACALESANATSPRVCCESSSYMNYCLGQPAGTYCQSVDSMCASGLCIAEFCADEKLEAGQTCTTSDHCNSRSCGLVDANFSRPTVCCESELTVLGDVEGQQGSFCGSMPTGTFCGTVDAMCASGFCHNQTCVEKLDNNEECETASHCLSNACGLAVPLVDTPNVCCESGSTTTAYLHENDGVFYEHSHEDNPWNNGAAYQVCASLAANKPCESAVSSACASGLCINQTCSEAVLDPNTVCKRDRECKSGACAHAIADASSETVCCESGTYVSGDVLNGNAKICGNATIGVFCYNLASMCDGGYCIGGTCAGHKGGPNSQCRRSSECENDVCGLSEARSDAPLVCCESNLTVTSPLLSDPSSSGAVCSQLKSGTYCHENGGICETGACGTDGYCE